MRPGKYFRHSLSLIPLLLVIISIPCSAFQKVTNSKVREWAPIHSADPGEMGASPIWSIYFNDELYGWALAGTLLKTEDGGVSWERQLLKENSILQDFDFSDRLNGWVVGGELVGWEPGNKHFAPMIIKTSDGGYSWEEQKVVLPAELKPETDVAIRDISMCDEKVGWAISENIAFRTSDGGRVWQPRYFDTSSSLNGVACGGEKIGIAIGDKGLILETYDGGDNWRKERFSPAVDFRSVRVFGDKAWIAGQRGVLLSLSLSRKDRVVRPLKTDKAIFDVFFQGEFGWAVGASGTMLQTRDGGITWSKQTSPTKEDLYCVFFREDGLGWVGGESERIFRHESEGLARY